MLTHRRRKMSSLQRSLPVVMLTHGRRKMSSLQRSFPIVSMLYFKKCSRRWWNEISWTQNVLPFPRVTFFSTRDSTTTSGGVGRRKQNVVFTGRHKLTQLTSHMLDRKGNLLVSGHWSVPHPAPVFWCHSMQVTC